MKLRLASQSFRYQVHRKKHNTQFAIHIIEHAGKVYNVTLDPDLPPAMFKEAVDLDQVTPRCPLTE